MQRTVDSLRFQLAIERVPLSKSAAELRRFAECQQDNDPLVNPVDKRVNPWAEKSKCEIL